MGKYVLKRLGLAIITAFIIYPILVKCFGKKDGCAACPCCCGGEKKED